jgi:hypothetical protein
LQENKEGRRTPPQERWTESSRGLTVPSTRRTEPPEAETHHQLSTVAAQRRREKSRESLGEKVCRGESLYI